MAGNDATLERMPSRIRAGLVVGDEGCWLWTGRLRDGYGVVAFAGGSCKVYALAWAWTHDGELPEDGLVLDHLCRVRSCCNPAHLEPVTRGQNAMRGETIAAAHATKTVCPHGHAYDAGNTDVTPDGRRDRRKCRITRKRAHVARQRALIEGRP